MPRTPGSRRTPTFRRCAASWWRTSPASSAPSRRRLGIARGHPVDWAEFWKQAEPFGFWHVPLTVVAIIVGAVVLRWVLLRVIRRVVNRVVSGVKKKHKVDDTRNSRLLAGAVRVVQRTRSLR